MLKTTRNMLKGSKLWAKAAVMTTVAAGASAAGLATAPSASAAAYPAAVYAPNKINGYQARAWAVLERDCSGTYGCWNYLQIDVMRWYGPTMVNGWWANANGWNSITANLLPGCYEYRTRADSYNYATGDVGGGVNAGAVGVTANGQAIYEWHVEWNSGWHTICR